ncbi:MAG TPA: hypothetical protein VM285_12420 [Polyangia bacterium]|nr:hypothetical protein [Polyangia bacterium]
MGSKRISDLAPGEIDIVRCARRGVKYGDMSVAETKKAGDALIASLGGKPKAIPAEMKKAIKEGTAATSTHAENKTKPKRKREAAKKPKRKVS